MRLAAFTLAAAAALTAATAASAQSAEGLELGLQTYGYDYKETFEGGSIKDEGRFTGFTVDYGRRVGGFSFDARFRYAEGEIDYSADDGAGLDDVQQTVGQLELLAGRPFAASPTTTVTPYVGIGSRVLLDESGGQATEDGISGYDRDIGYVYLPLGAAARFRQGERMSLVIYGQLNVLVGGRARSDFSTIEPGAPVVETEFNGGRGLEFGASLGFAFRGGRINVGPFYRSWDIDQSDSFVVTDPDEGTIELFEPPNRTREFGIKLSYGF